MILLSPVRLLLLALSGCFTEVVDDFNNTCPQFFVNPGGIRSPPTVFTGKNYKQICQIRDNEHEYATLYDTDNKIPVYSAYRFEGLKNCDRADKWYIEPQLEDISKGKKMERENKSVQYIHQAVNADYYKTGFHRGHLAPVFHAKTQSCADATFTLTNAAPQDKIFNKGQWKKTEKDVAILLVDKCKGNSRYIVTGVVPDKNRTPLNKRVTVPSHFWTAYCCIDNNHKVTASGGYLGKNKQVQVEALPVGELDKRLTALYGQRSFQVFGGKCDKSITNFALIQSRGLSLILCLDDDLFPTLFEKRKCMTLLRQKRKGR
ncbi:endonuclease domain-containing 1 protein-like [Hoplias malabaricus]|uniref:endonuclease domain-containing 1 protein-like n=1 Tax=Hoplias malabaricus TaxID=27720 RepID=UPI003462740F